MLPRWKKEEKVERILPDALLANVRCANDHLACVPCLPPSRGMGVFRRVCRSF
jgi:hypothetical protein